MSADDEEDPDYQIGELLHAELDNLIAVLRLWGKMGGPLNDPITIEAVFEPRMIFHLTLRLLPDPGEETHVPI